jgi:hypothetical protein
MHVKFEDRGFVLDSNNERKIEEFLVYDSRVRKVNRQAEFQALQDVLKIQFQAVLKERDRLIAEETKRLPKKETPYVGVK